MTLCRRSQKLATSDGVLGFLLQAFCRPTLIRGQQRVDDPVLREEVRYVCTATQALRGQQRTEALVLREEVRYVCTSTQGQWPDSTRRSELSPIRQNRLFELPRKAGPGTMSRCLVKKLMGLSDVKEDVYGALDEWAAFELEFPVIATRLALQRLRKQEQWHRVIQVTKWMFSKGIGKTHGSYGLLLKAYCMQGRLDEAEELWNSLTALNGRSMPKILFAFMTNAYRKQQMPTKIIEVFGQMESFGIKPDKDTLMRAKEAFQQLNMEEKVDELGKKYAIDSRTRRKEKRLKEREAKKSLKLEKSVDKAEVNGSLEYQTDGDEEHAEKQVSIAPVKEAMAFSSKTEETSNRSKSLRRAKSRSTSTAEDEFVRQVIDTM